MNIADYEIVFEKSKRYYVENLSQRDFYLEFTTPHLLKIDDLEILENNWVEMIRSLAAYLISSRPKDKNDLLDFKTCWSKADIFDTVERVNFRKIEENLYINCNHTALHSCWLIQDLLDLFCLDKNNLYFLIHRSPAAEPKKVKDYFINKFNDEFSEFLKTNYGKSDNSINIILKNITDCMNPYLAKISRSYNDFRLFDDSNTLSNYSNKMMKEINNNQRISLKTKSIIERYLSYLLEFYKL